MKELGQRWKCGIPLVSTRCRPGWDLAFLHCRPLGKVGFNQAVAVVEWLPDNQWKDNQHYPVLPQTSMLDLRDETTVEREDMLSASAVRQKPPRCVAGSASFEPLL